MYLTTIGMRIDETGTLLRVGSGLHLRRDLGGRYILELSCTLGDLDCVRVRVIGTLVGPDLVNVEGLVPV